MRIAVAFVLGVVTSFLLAGWLRGQATTIDTDAMTRAWLQPPPLSLPDGGTCTRPEDAVVQKASPEWTSSTIEAHLHRLAGDHPEVELVDVDCDESPCVAWLFWADGRNDPELAFRWWSLEGDRGDAIWTASRVFDVGLPDAPDGMLQAVSITLPDHSEATLDHLSRRVDDRIDELRAKVRLR